MAALSRSLSALLLCATVLIITTPARAANCGGGVSCSCGDVVVQDHTLSDGDPITSSVCPNDGLTVRDRVTLDLGGNVIRGSQGAGSAGLRLGSRVIVGNGTVTGFETGVDGTPERFGVRLHDIHVLDSGAQGIFLDGDFNLVERCVVKRTGGFGILVLGSRGDTTNANTVRRCRVEDNQGTGIDVAFNRNIVTSNIVRRNSGSGILVGGDGNLVNLNQVESNGFEGIFVGGGSDLAIFGPSTVARNTVFRNTRHGVAIGGDGVLVDRNQSKYNGGEGFSIGGRQHTVFRNVAVSNAQDGFTVSGHGCLFDRNRADYNGRPAAGFGILDGTGGSGTAGTANSYVNNGCTGNGLGASSPPGLCR